MTGETLHGIFTATARRAPARTAVEDDTGSVSYGDLNARANRLAHALIARGVRPETTVAICLERSIDLVAGILGILKAGGAYVPLDATCPSERLQYMVSDSGVRCIVTRKSLQPLFAGQESRLIFIDDASDLDGPPHLDVDPPDAAAPGHLAYVIYTSGSTGLPKGVLVEHGQVVNSLRGLEAAFPTGPDDAYLFKSNHTFDASLLELFGPMWHGGRVVILRPGGERDSLAVLDAVARHAVTHLFYVTSMMEALLGTCPSGRIDALRALKHLLVGGEAMNARLAARLRLLGGSVRVANVYGPTETAIICAAFPLDGEIEARSAPIGTMLGGLSAHVLDPAGREVPAGAVGELHIGGASVARGYLNAPDLTARRFVGGPRGGPGRLYRTGDLCRLTADGQLEFIDRVDRQVKVRGYRVELGEIERQLVSHPDVRAAAVTATGTSGDLRLSAYYVASHASLAVPPLALRRYLRRFLPDHMVPVAWLQMPDLPVNENGKVDRKALPAIEVERVPRPAGGPRATSDVIADTWAVELGTRAIGPDDNFFALGGHSLSAARVAVALGEALGRVITVSDLYKAPTVAELARVLALAPPVAGEASTDCSTPERRPGDSGPLSYEQLGFWVLDKLGLPFLNVIARRRVSGEIDGPALAAALDRVVATHPALRSRFGRWVPRQSTAERCPTRLVERDFSAMGEAEAERAALRSMDELARRSQWQPGEALVEVRLVKVAPHVSEVQVSMPHIVSDEASAAIVFDDLSRHYQGIVRREPSPVIGCHDGFDRFIRDERAAIRGTLRESAGFWERYLDDASPIFFPESEVLPPDTRAESVYIELPVTWIERLRQVGRDHGLGIAELLYGASLRAVERVAEPFPEAARPLLHTPRSARDRAGYDGAVGLFARIDFLKVDTVGATDLVALARRVRRADLETAPHQRCPTMIKSAALQKRRWQPYDRLCRAAAWAATALMPGADLDIEVALAQTRLAAMRRTAERDFAVGVNVLNSFIGEPVRTLFGLPLAHAPVHPTYDPPFRRVLELYFLRDAGGYQLMLNGDLRPAFRAALGRAVVREIEQVHAAA
ncbi:MAG: amino acid adenylation domain-containing protein [Vicinamibacterales bacterium]